MLCSGEPELSMADLHVSPAGFACPKYYLCSHEIRALFFPTYLSGCQWILILDNFLNKWNFGSKVSQ